MLVKMRSYLMCDVNEEEKAKWTKKCVVKRKIKFSRIEKVINFFQEENYIDDMPKQINEQF